MENNTKLYPCNRKKCGEKCSDICYLTQDPEFAVNRDKYLLFGDIVKVHKEFSRQEGILFECGYSCYKSRDRYRPFRNLAEDSPCFVDAPALHERDTDI